MLPDERTYWAEQMEAGYAFMQRMLDWPVAECREPLRCIRAAAEAAGVEVAYEPGKKIGLFDRIFRVRVSLVDRLLAAGC